MGSTPSSSREFRDNRGGVGFELVKRTALFGDFGVEVEAGGGFCGEGLGRDGEFVV